MGDEFDIENFQKELDEDNAKHEEEMSAIENVCPVCGGDTRNHSQTQLMKCHLDGQAYSPEDIVKKFEDSSYYTPDNQPAREVAILKVLLEIRDLLLESEIAREKWEIENKANAERQEKSKN